MRAALPKDDVAGHDILLRRLLGAETFSGPGSSFIGATLGCVRGGASGSERESEAQGRQGEVRMEEWKEG